MKNEYSPASWVILEINTPEFGQVQKVLAGWPGKWKLSSGFSYLEDCGDYFKAEQISGSLYLLRKDLQGLGGMLEHVFESISREASKMGHIKVVKG